LERGKIIKGSNKKRLNIFPRRKYNILKPMEEKAQTKERERVQVGKEKKERARLVGREEKKTGKNGPGFPKKIARKKGVRWYELERGYARDKGNAKKNKRVDI